MSDLRRRKIYFAPTSWASSDQIADDYVFQTPGNSGTWGSISLSKDVMDSDYLIVQDDCHDKQLLGSFDRDHKIYLSREALTPRLHSHYPALDYRRFTFWDSSGYLVTKWVYGSGSANEAGRYSGLGKTYDELSEDMQGPKKTMELATVLSNKSFTKGHRIRKRFAKKLSKSTKIDIYGSVGFANAEIKGLTKYEVLSQYRHTLGFDNQDTIPNFFGTQFTDAVLSMSVPIFWCGTDLSLFFPADSFIQIDAKDYTWIPRIVESLGEANYSKRQDSLLEAKRLILNKYNMWPTLETLINQLELGARN